MASKHSNSGHNDDHSSGDHGKPFVSENSLHDRLLSAIAALVLVGILILGFYWYSLPLPTVELEEESGGTK